MLFYQTCIVLFPYICAAFLVAFSALGTALGQMKASREAFLAIDRQPAAQKTIIETFILGMAILEASSLLGFGLGALLLQSFPLPLNGSIASLGVVCALGIPAFFVGLYGALPIMSGISALARQPFFTGKITQLLMITQTLLQTSLILGLLIAAIIQKNLSPELSLAQALAFFASGICIGFGSIGTIVGIGKFSYNIVRAAAVNTKKIGRFMSYSAISISLIETSAIFAFIISLLIFKAALSPALTLLQAYVMLSAALLIAVGNCASALGSAKIASAGADALAFVEVGRFQDILRTSMLGQVFVDSLTIYTFVVALLLTTLI